MAASSPRPVALGRVSTVDALGDALRIQILSGEILPGSPLRESDLAQMFGVSRHTARAALLSLAHEGLARHEPNRGAHVPKLSADEIEDLFSLRAIMELAAIDALIADSARLALVDAALDALRALPSDSPWTILRDADLRFHAALVEGLGSTRASSVQEGVLREVRLCFAALREGLVSPDDVAEQHARIVDRIRAGNRAGASELLRHHLEESKQAIIAASLEGGTGS